MDTTSLYKAWGARVAARRNELEIHQAALAAMVGTTQQTISNIETGYRRPSDALRPKIAAALGVDVLDLFPYEVAA